MTGYILRHEAHFRAVMEEQLRLESSEQIRIRRKRLERNENRIAELKRLFIRIYEDNACGRLSDERFDMLSLTYETEQKQLETECVTLRQEIEVQERQNENVEKFIQTAHKYTAVTRAKAKVILIGQKQAVFVAIHKCDVGQRNTVLADRIVAYYNRELSRRVA